MLELLRGILGNYENIRTVSSGMAAIRAARERRPDLIILDIQMPDLDGLATCEIMRADPRLAKVPIIFLTARRDSETVVNCFKAGGSDFVAKPLRRW
ncbi:MAG TPA: response regulator, partial [Phenylobacterium sp.]|nr:response regulator [Phenylobacterium sp.]